MPDHQRERQATNHDANETRTVSVSEDYLAFLHEMLSGNQVRLREILGGRQAKAIFNWSADQLVRTVKADRYASGPVEGAVQQLTRWGMAVSWKEVGNTTELEIRCPYAERIHPQMASREAMCPLGEYILGAVRLEESKAQLMHNNLTKEGATFAFEWPKDNGSPR